MERSQSYTSFDTSINNGNNNNNNNNSNNPNACENNLRKALEMRQTQLQQQQQQQQQLQQHQHTGSEDNTISNNNNSTNFHSIPVPLRRKLLQRQKSTEFLDDLNYATEEEEQNDGYEEEEELPKLRNDVDDDDEQSFVKPQLPPSSIPQPPPTNKQVRFQKHKPISDSALIKDDASAALKSKSVEANINIIVEVADSNNNNNKNKNNTIKYPLKHKQTSFDSAILNAKPGTAAFACRRNHPCNAQLRRDNSIHSDSSCYSSVDSLLEARKPDPETILINLGFGPMPGSEDILSKIPKRFLKPSQVRGIDTNAFVKRIQLAHCLADHSSLGYRGLVGNPDIRPSTIVGKIMERFEVNQRKKSMGSAEHTTIR